MCNLIIKQMPGIFMAIRVESLMWIFSEVVRFALCRFYYPILSHRLVFLTPSPLHDIRLITDSCKNYYFVVAYYIERTMQLYGT